MSVPEKEFPRPRTENQKERRKKMKASWSKTIQSVLACSPRVLFLPTKQQSARPIYSHDNVSWKSSAAHSRCTSFKTKWRCCAVKPSCGVEVAVCGRNHMGPKTNIAKHSSRPQASTQCLRCDPLFICLRFRDVLFSAESVVSSQG